MLLNKFTSNNSFKEYDEFYGKFKLIVPRNFNYAYDVVDAIAKENPERPALVWCDEKGDEKHFNFMDMQNHSSRAAHLFRLCGVTKGDRVLLLLKRRYEFWFILLALHRIGAVAIPATGLLSCKRYRISRFNRWCEGSSGVQRPGTARARGRLGSSLATESVGWRVQDRMA